MTPQNKLYEAAKAVINRNLPVDKIYNNLDKLKEAISAYEQSIEQPCMNFEHSNDSTSATICKHCGKEKHVHSNVEYIEQPEAIAGENDITSLVDETFKGLAELINDDDLFAFYKQLIVTLYEDYTSAKDKEIVELKERISVIKEKLPDNKIRNLNPIWVRDEIISELEKQI